MKDRDVRESLYTHLLTQHASVLDHTQFVDELDLCGRVRVDVAVLNGELSGYELKSERDTLERLPLQITVYSSVLDRASIVVAEKHLVRAREAVPPWWGVLIAEAAQRGVRIWCERAALTNPAPDPCALVQLLWRDEVLVELHARGLDRGVRGAPRARLWSQLTGAVSTNELRAIVRERLKARQGWRVARPLVASDVLLQSAATS